MTVPSDPDDGSPESIHPVQLHTRRAGSETTGLEPRMQQALVVVGDALPGPPLFWNLRGLQPWHSSPLTLSSCYSRARVLGV
jgi:hypothetical protein